MASRLRQWFDFSLLYLLLLLAGLLPRRLLLGVGRALGSLVWSVFRYRRRVVLDHLVAAFGPGGDPADQCALARAFYRNLGMTLMEFLALPRLKTGDIRSLVKLEGEEFLQEAAASGGGALLVSAHFGNWELLGARVAAEGYQVRYLIKTQSNLRVDRVQNRIRNQAGVGTIRTGQSVKELVRALRRGELVGLLADQDAGREGYFTQFLGRAASVFRGTAIWKTPG